MEMATRKRGYDEWIQPYGHTVILQTTERTKHIHEHKTKVDRQNTIRPNTKPLERFCDLETAVPAKFPTTN